MMKRGLCVFLEFPGAAGGGDRLSARSTSGFSDAVLCEVLRRAKKAAPDEMVICLEPGADEAAGVARLSPRMRDCPFPIRYLTRSAEDSGEELDRILASLFGEDSGASSFLCIGTACPELDRSLFLEAWSRLEKEREAVVLGPLRHGGYYLVGLNAPVPRHASGAVRGSDGPLTRIADRTTGQGRSRSFLSGKTAVECRGRQNGWEDRPCVFFDRDGVVNRSPGEGYVLRREQWQLEQGLIDALEVVDEADHYAVVVTSQKGVGKGLMTEETLGDIHRLLQAELAGQGLAFDAIFAFTGLPGCNYAPKPDPAMIEAACRIFPIDPAESWIVGDADRDIEMGRRAGLGGTIRVRGAKPVTIPADHTIENVLELPDLLRKLL